MVDRNKLYILLITLFLGIASFLYLSGKITQLQKPQNSDLLLANKLGIIDVYNDREGLTDITDYNKADRIILRSSDLSSIEFDRIQKKLKVYYGRQTSYSSEIESERLISIVPHILSYDFKLPEYDPTYDSLDTNTYSINQINLFILSNTSGKYTLNDISLKKDTTGKLIVVDWIENPVNLSNTKNKLVELYKYDPLSKISQFRLYDKDSCAVEIDYIDELGKEYIEGNLIRYGCELGLKNTNTLVKQYTYAPDRYLTINYKECTESTGEVCLSSIIEKSMSQPNLEEGMTFLYDVKLHDDEYGNRYIEALDGRILAKLNESFGMSYDNSDLYRENNALYIAEGITPIVKFSKLYQNFIKASNEVKEYPTEFDEIFKPQNTINNCFDLNLNRQVGKNWELYLNTEDNLNNALKYSLVKRNKESIENFILNKDTFLNSLSFIPQSYETIDIDYAYIVICNVNGIDYGLVNLDIGGYIGLIKNVYTDFDIHELPDFESIYFSCYDISGNEADNLYIDCGGGDGGYGRHDKLIYDTKQNTIYKHQICEYTAGIDEPVCQIK